MATAYSTVSRTVSPWHCYCIAGVSDSVLLVALRMPSSIHSGVILEHWCSLVEAASPKRDLVARLLSWTQAHDNASYQDACCKRCSLCTLLAPSARDLVHQLLYVGQVPAWVSVVWGNSSCLCQQCNESNYLRGISLGISKAVQVNSQQMPSSVHKIIGKSNW